MSKFDVLSPQSAQSMRPNPAITFLAGCEATWGGQTSRETSCIFRKRRRVLLSHFADESICSSSPLKPIDFSLLSASHFPPDNSSDVWRVFPFISAVSKYVQNNRDLIDHSLLSVREYSPYVSIGFKGRKSKMEPKIAYQSEVKLPYSG